ncbi:MAG: hypothetical protein J6A15_01885 [Clostridia bacterium]|nr:hypothetical protein [Clostridia bacterium]
MDNEERLPIGEDFVKRKILTKKDVKIVLNYQEEHPELKFGEIVDVLDMCEKEDLLEVLSSNLGVKSAIIERKLDINPINFLPSDIIITYRALPFKKVNNTIYVAFANPQDTETVEYVRKLIAKEGYEIEVYISLYTTILAHIEKIKNSKQVRMCFSDTNEEPEIKEEDIGVTILEEIKNKFRRK